MELYLTFRKFLWSPGYLKYQKRKQTHKARLVQVFTKYLWSIREIFTKYLQVFTSMCWLLSCLQCACLKRLCNVWMLVWMLINCIVIARIFPVNNVRLMYRFEYSPNLWYLCFAFCFKVLESGRLDWVNGEEGVYIFPRGGYTSWLAPEPGL